MIRTSLDQLLTGKPKPFADNGEMSAIAKNEVDEPLWLGVLGLAGNQVADTVHHGGPDKAVHLYPADHYPFWRDQYPDVAVLDQPGAFGENFSCSGLTEDMLCLGDIFRVGEALIECSHARQPCWKLNYRFGRPDVMKTIVRTARSGSYFRVLEEGHVRAGDDLVQQDRPMPEWPLDRLFRLIIGGQHKGRADELRLLSDNPALAKVWQVRAAQLASA